VGYALRETPHQRAVATTRWPAPAQICQKSPLPLKKAAVEIDKRFVEYLLELSDGVTGRIIEVLRRAAYQAIADKSQRVGLQQLQYMGAPHAISHWPKVVIFP
jgi:hypothetical protein